MTEGRERTKTRAGRRQFGFAVLLAAATIVIAACVPPPPPPPQGTISGTLSNGSIPLTQHGLVATDASGNTVGSTNTDGSGNYAMQVPPGSYRVNYVGGGPCHGEWFDNKPDLATADVVTVVDGGTATASAVLDCPTISGRVTNGSGTGLSGVQVHAFGFPAPFPSLPASTDANGNYRVFAAPGNHKVRFTRSDGCVEWFSDKANMNSADLVNVPAASGAVANAVLDCGMIAGVVTDGSNPMPNLSVVALDTAGNAVADDLTAANGSYSILVPPGNYKVLYSATCGEWFDNKTTESSADVVTVSPAGTTTANASLECATISGTITDGTNPLGFTRIDLYDGAGDPVTLGNAADANGHFAFQLAPGTYTLQFTNPSGGGDEWFDDEDDQVNADVVTLAAGDHVVANVVLGSGQIFGTVTDGSNNPVPNVVVDVYDAEGDLVTSTTTETDGFYGTHFIGARVYFVRFSHPSFATEWWNNKTDLAAANPVIVTVGNTTTANAALTP